MSPRRYFLLICNDLLKGIRRRCMSMYSQGGRHYFVWEYLYPDSAASPLGRFGEMILLVLDTPDQRGKSSDGWRLSAPRESHPRVGLTRPPPLPVTVLNLPGSNCRRLWLDGSIIVLVAGRCHAGSHPALIAGWNRSLPLGRSWRSR